MAWNFIRRWFGNDGLRRSEGIQTEDPQRFADPAITVTKETAMQISAVWAAVQLQAKTLASLSLDFYRMTAEGKERDREYHLAKLFRRKVNRYQTRTEFFETVGLNLYLTGNAYCLIERLGGKVVSLLPLMSSQVRVALLEDGTITYEYHTDRGVAVYGQDAIWHLKLYGNGIVGLSPLEYATNSVALAMSSESWATSIVKDGGKPTGVLTIDVQSLTPQQREQIREKYRDLRQGPRNSLMVLEGPMSYQQVSMSPQDLQLLESRRYQIEDIARFFGVPSVLINDTSSTTVWGSGIQQIITGWYKLGFRPDLSRIETSIMVNLMPPGDWDDVIAEFDFDELLRTDFDTRVAAGAKAVGSGLITRDEWRGREGLRKMGGSAGELTVQSNMISIDDLEKVLGNDDENDE